MPTGEPTAAEVAAVTAELQAAIAGSAAPAAPADPTPPIEPGYDRLPIPTSDVSWDENGQVILSADLIRSALPTLQEYGLTERDAATVQNALTSGTPVSVTQAQVDEAKARKAQVMRDPEWVKRFLGGGEAESRLMMSINLRLTAQVVTP